MNNFLKNTKERLKNKGREGAFFLLLSFGVLVACQGVLEDANPFSPSTSSLRILPSIATVTTGANLLFTTLGGTAPFSWTSSNTNVGTIIVNTGLFTGGATLGTTTVTAVDAVGNTATASVTIPGLALLFDVTGATQVAAVTDDIITILANGSGAGFTATFVNNNNVSTFLLSPTAVSTGTTLTITSPAAPLPTVTQGNQTFTVTVTDTGNTNTGTLTYILQADPTTP